MHTFPIDWVWPAVGIITAAWALFRHRRQLTDAERAELLRELAESAAAVVMAAFPGKPWAEYVNMIVKRLLTMPGVPTKNASALEGAANKAVLTVGAALKNVPPVR